MAEDRRRRRPGRDRRLPQAVSCPGPCGGKRLASSAFRRLFPLSPSQSEPGACGGQTRPQFLQAAHGCRAWPWWPPLASSLLGMMARLVHWDIPGLDAYAGYAIAAALFLALPGTLQHGDHIRVTLLLDRVPAACVARWSGGAWRRPLALRCTSPGTPCRLVWVSYTTHDMARPRRCLAAVDSADQHGAGLHRLCAGLWPRAHPALAGGSFIAGHWVIAHVE
jgi:hypothetical protein